jgi:hypothetical protein
MEAMGQITSVAGVLTLLLAVLWWLRRRGYAQVMAFGHFSARQSRRRMERLEKLILSPQHTLHLIRLGDTAMLIAASPAGCCLIQALPSAAVDGAVVRQEAVR